jgi:hypothetical protein
MNLKTRISPLLIVVLALWPCHSRAASEALQNFSGGAGGYVNGTAGWTFQVQTDVAVTSLGFFDFLFSSNPEPIQVGLWAPDGSLLASSAITSTSTLFHQSRYEPITPINLVPDTIYHLGAYSPSGTIIVEGVNPADGGSITMAPTIHLRGYAVSFGGFSSPSEPDGSDGAAVIAPNFLFSDVPEPGTLALLGFGALVAFATKKLARR